MTEAHNSFPVLETTHCQQKDTTTIHIVRVTIGTIEPSNGKLVSATWGIFKGNLSLVFSFLMSLFFNQNTYVINMNEFQPIEMLRDTKQCQYCSVMRKCSSFWEKLGWKC